MTKIIIRNVAQLKAFTNKLRMVSVVLPTLQRNALESASDETVLSDIHRDMMSNNFSEKIIDATFVGPIELLNSGKKARIHFISDYVDPKTGFDVSDAREHGTASGVKRRPKKPNGSLKIPLKTGGFIFRKSATPNGIERLLIIQKNINKNKQIFKESYDKKIVSTLSQLVKI